MRDALIQAASRLRDKHFLNGAGDALSLLQPGSARLWLLEHGGQVREVALDNPGEGLAALHAEVYRLRGDVGAVANLSPCWSLQLGGLNEAMPSVFDEQARHIGRSWAPSTASRLPALLAAGGNAGLVDGRLLAVGVTRNRMLFNAELFEKCAMAYVLARLGGGKVKQVPLWVNLIANRRLLKDEARAAASHAAGQAAAELGAY